MTALEIFGIFVLAVGLLYLLLDLVETMHAVRDELKGASYERSIARAERENRIIREDPNSESALPAHIAEQRLVPRG